MTFEYDRSLVNMEQLNDSLQFKCDLSKKNLLTPWDILNSSKYPITYEKDNSEVYIEKSLNEQEDNENEQEFSECDSDCPLEDDDDDDSDSDWENLASNRMKEIQRKEEIIIQKEKKASRLIEIIREKNDEIVCFKKKNLEQRRLIWKLYKKIHDSDRIANLIIN